MKIKTLKKAVQLAQKLNHVFVVTADTNGLPHVAAADKLTLLPGNRLEATYWFCPGTIANLKVNPHLSLVIWDANIDNGYQLLGKAEKLEDTVMLNGYMPGIENKSTYPQVERKLQISVNKVLDFKHAPHNDVEE